MLNLKVRKLLGILMCMPVALTAQTGTSYHGIKFIQGIGWQQVLSKAKSENKYIFVDCFAGWCGPCKKMDKDVYLNDIVGNLMNDKFISVKVQMDTARQGGGDQQKWYADAKMISENYKVAVYPTYLFFLPTGQLVDKGFGYKDTIDFIEMAQDALDPSRQFYSLLNKYKQGRKDYAGMPYLINKAKALGDDGTYVLLINDYYNYLMNLSQKELYTKKNIQFISTTIDSSVRKPFKLFYPDGKKIDSVMGKQGYAAKMVDQIIFVEKIAPFFHSNQGGPEPDWNILYDSIKNTFGADYAVRNVIHARVHWYGSYGDYSSYATYLNMQIDKYGTDTTDLGEDFRLNNDAFFFIFRNVTDAVQINMTIKWMEGVIRRAIDTKAFHHVYYPMYIDTYANLLYKAGRRDEALQWEERALNGSIELKNEEWIKEYSDNFNKMKQGKPTWPVAVKKNL